MCNGLQNKTQQPCFELCSHRCHLRGDATDQRKGEVRTCFRLSFHKHFSQQVATRSSAQGNCSAKSLAPVISSILPCPPCLLHRGGVKQGEGGLAGEGGWGRGRGQGIFHLPCHVLHYHMVLRPEGTSHNKYKQLSGVEIFSPVLSLTQKCSGC